MAFGGLFRYDAVSVLTPLTQCQNQPEHVSHVASTPAVLDLSVDVPFFHNCPAIVLHSSKFPQLRSCQVTDTKNKTVLHGIFKKKCLAFLQRK